MPLGSRSALVLLLLGILAPGVLPAQEPYLVREINQDTKREKGLTSHEVLAASMGPFYSFDDGLHGPELWRGDSLVRDLCPGPCGSSPRDFAEWGGKVYFFADDGVTGLELWRTDGTPGGTTLVRDLCPGPCSDWPDAGASLVPAGKALFFRARDDDGLVGLWTSDDTRAGTRRVADICPGCNAGIFDLTAAGDSVFFRADDGIHGLEIWSSDGIATTLLRDECPGACSSGPARDQPDLFTSYEDGVFYWQLVAGHTGRWRLRSTAGDPEDQPIELDHSVPPRLVVVGSALLLTAGRVLARIDIPTFTLAEVHGFGVSVGPVAALGNAVFFAGHDPGHGFELWRSDGTGAGTQLVKDTVPGPGSGAPRSLVAAAGKLFFIAGQDDSLWVSDGTATWTSEVFLQPALRVVSLTPDPVGKRLLFTTGDPKSSTAELWATNDSSPDPVRRINEVPGSIDLRSPTAFAGTLFFGDRELWRSDGTAGGTEILSALAAAPEDVAPFQGGLVFRRGSEIWKTDGTAGGTRRVLDDFNTDHLQVAGDRLFFSGFSMSGGLDSYTGFELWSSDGTHAGTRIVQDIVPGEDPTPKGPEARSSRPRQMTAVGANLFFVAHTPEEGAELWSSDGTPAGTALHTVLCAGPCSSDLHLLASFSGRLYFTAGTRTDLLSSSSAEKGAERAHRIGRSVPDPVAFQGRLFFFAEDSKGHEGLWSSDGTAPGSVFVREVSGLGQPRTAHEPTVVGDRLYFTSWNEATGQELWVSDGTAGGTHLLAEVRPGPQSSAPRHLAAAAARLFFSADDGSTGQELWMTDGRVTRRAGDIAPGPGSAAPEDLTPAGDRLFFSADDGKNGRELWALDTTRLYVRCVPSANRLCLDGGRFEVTVILNPRLGKLGTAIPDSDQSGFFWFFTPGNLELVVKVLDGRSANGHFWVLFGALSDVEYTVTVMDRATDAVRTYHNPRGTLCGQADTTAFPDPDGATAPSRFVPFDPVPATAAAAAGPCTPGPSELCLGGGRFRVEARWRNGDHGEGTGTAVPRTAESGSFWFFSPGNTELVVKVLDGTPVNGKFWVFYGALSDVEYWLTVTDTVTGVAKTYHNPPGNYCGRGDTEGL